MAERHTLQVELTAQEYDWLQAKSEETGKTIKQIIRQSLILIWSIDNITKGGEIK